MIKDFIPRLYQETILGTCIEKNTLVVLPTGLGKTAIAMMLSAQRLRMYPDSKILFLAPTKPLAQQHLLTFEKNFVIETDKMVLFTGEVRPEIRESLWNDAKIIFSTPQGLENDLISNKISLENVSLVVFDEAHRATGDYAYNFAAKQYNQKSKYPRILGLTASPGSDIEKILEVCKNLFIEDVEIRTYDDPDVKPYIKEIDVDWVYIDLPEEIKQVQKYIQACYKSKLVKLKEWGVLKRTDISMISKKEMLLLQGQLHGQALSERNNFVLWNAISVAAEAMKIQHALELLETQGITALHSYFEKLRKEAVNTKVKAVKNLVSDSNFKSAVLLTEKLFESGFEHPKIDVLKGIISKEVSENNKVKIIVFNQYRDSASKILEVLNNLEGVNAKLFVGQLKKGETGLTQKEQKKVMEEFKGNEFNVLISTSVGEEGIDIPKVDLVIFYEPIPSAIRHIQRRGRTGRQEKGRVMVLVANDTRDVGYRWSAHHKEKKMYKILENLKRTLVLRETRQNVLTKYAPQENLKVFADFREKGSGLMKELIDMGVVIDLKKIGVGDYVVSSRVGIEMKTVPDFVDSLIDGRLLQQVKELKENYDKPLIVVEGVEDIYSQRNVHPNAIIGVLATIAISYGIPLLFTKTARESASLVHLIAKREQEETKKEFSLRSDKKPLTLKEQQEYIVSSLPGIGPRLAKPLLNEFKTPKNVMNASETDLQRVEKIGVKKARQIRVVLDTEYTG